MPKLSTNKHVVAAKIAHPTNSSLESFPKTVTHKKAACMDVELLTTSIE